MSKWLIAVGLVAGLLVSLPSAAGRASAVCKVGMKISEEGFVRIDGIEQWVTIRGADCANPVILMVHGGPGNPSTPFAENLYGAWEKDFTLVQWDQRGSGKTFARNPDTAIRPLTIALMARDGVEVAAYATRRLGKREVILFGGSWGSVLAINMLKLKPELFSAYQGTSQLVEYHANQNATYKRALELTRAADDKAAVTRSRPLVHHRGKTHAPSASFVASHAGTRQRRPSPRRTRGGIPRRHTTPRPTRRPIPTVRTTRTCSSWA
jgi:pimeloyl-ACP methyl ester carboxylesterase